MNDEKIQKKCQQLKSFFFKKRRLFAHKKKILKKKFYGLKLLKFDIHIFSIFCYLCSYAIVTSYLEWTSYLYSIHLAYSRFALFSSGDVSFKMKIGIKKVARKIYVARKKCNGRSKFKERIYSLRIFSSNMERNMLLSLQVLNIAEISFDKAFLYRDQNRK